MTHQIVNRQIEDLHGVYVVLLGVAPSQEEVGDRCGLIRPEWVHSWSFSVQALTNFNYAMPCGLQPFGRGEQLQHLHREKSVSQVSQSYTNQKADKAENMQTRLLRMFAKETNLRNGVHLKRKFSGCVCCNTSAVS